MKRTKITLILTIIAIIIFSCGKSNAELKNEFINLTKDKIFLGGYDRFNKKKRIIYTFDENGNIVDDKNEIKYYYDSAKSGNEFYFYFISEGYEEIITNYTGFIISNNIIREMVHQNIGEDEDGFTYVEKVKNKKELQKLYSKEGSYIAGILFDKEEYNDYKNIVKTYKYSDFFGTFESEDKKFFISLAQHKNIRRINNVNVYSMLYGLYGSDYTNEYSPQYDGSRFYRGVFYNNSIIYSQETFDGEDYTPDFNFIIIDKDTLLHVISDDIYSYKDYSGFLKRKK